MENISKKSTKRIAIEAEDELHAEVKIRAAQRGVSVKVWVKRAIMAQIKKEEQYE